MSAELNGQQMAQAAESHAAEAPDVAAETHTEVGHACVGARVNGRLVSLSHQLTSGDTCEIFTSKVSGSGPSRDWLQIVQTPRAANKIRQWFSRERREDARETGKEDFQKQLRTMKVTGGRNKLEELKTMARFGRFFMGALIEVYGPTPAGPVE